MKPRKGSENYPAYSTWMSMIGRCHRPTHSAYHKYGGRGVAVCNRWRESFESFLADMGSRPEGTSIDRIDGARGYEPSNCRWATAIEQNANRRTSRLVTINGETATVNEWARRTGLTGTGFADRLDRGLAGAALLAPPRPYPGKRKRAA